MSLVTSGYQLFSDSHLTYVLLFYIYNSLYLELVKKKNVSEVNPCDGQLMRARSEFNSKSVTQFSKQLSCRFEPHFLTVFLINNRDKVFEGDERRGVATGLPHT